MSALLHSEGPWRVDLAEPEEFMPADVNVLRPDGLAVAVAVQNGDIEPAVAMGNAHLVSASLDMLEQCRLFERVIEFQIKVSASKGDDEGALLQSFTLAQLQAVIAKAEGRA